MSSEKRLTANLSPAGAWAFSIGTSIGWGSLVVTSNAYLAKGGPLGSALGLIVGAVIMLLMSRNYAFMIEQCPEAGGAYAYARDAFGYDHGFLTAWFLVLTYLAIFWANATALPLFARYFLGGVFQFGRMYSLFGYDVYLGEVLLTIAAILLTVALCVTRRNLAMRLMIGLAALLTAGITLCFAAAILRHDQSFEPLLLKEQSAIRQILNIAIMSPWAFIGFEGISHGAEEFRFKRGLSHRILVSVIITVTLLYIFVTLLSVTAYPPEYATWLDYIRDLGNLRDIKGLPAFYAAQHYLGGAGVTILMLTLLALVVTSLIGNITILSRLFYALARDHILPEQFAEVNRHGTPGKAMMLIAAVSVIIPFLGRTAISWIVDVTTLGATLIYGFVSAAAMKTATRKQNTHVRVAGAAGLVLMIGFGLYLLIPNLFSTGSMESESYLLFVVWSLIGFVYFRHILRQDQLRRFGKSIIVWISLLSLILFVSLIWMSQSAMLATNRAMTEMQDYYASAGFAGQTQIVSEKLQDIQRTNARSIIVVILLFAASLGVLLNNYALMNRRAEESEHELGIVRTIVHTDPLTGVKSKHSYIEKEQETDRLIESRQATDFAVVVCDLNGLKHVNDTQGHKAGDDYIRAASRMVCELFAHSPVYRTGGDEFVVFVSGRDFENRQALMDKLHETSVAHIQAGGPVISAGLSEYQPGRDARMHDVFERSDQLMYQEKKLLKSLGAKTRS